MNCKHCGKPIYCVDGLWFLEGTASIWCGNIKHEPASPVAPLEKELSLQEVLDEARSDVQSRPAWEKERVYGVAQSGAGGVLGKQNVIHELVDRCAQAHSVDMNADFFREILRKWGLPTDAPSSPSGQAAATMPETHTPKDEQF